MKLSKPSHFQAHHLIYDPIRKDAIVISLDEIITLTGPFKTYTEANAAMHDALRNTSRSVGRR